MNGSIFKILPTLIALALALSGCGGGGGDTQTETEEISGRITFDLVPFNTFTSGLDYSQTKVSPARGILVEAMDASANKVGSTTTDSNGYFSLNIDANSNLRLRVSAQLKQTSDPSWDVKVTDNTSNNALYVTEGNLFNSSTGNRVRNIHLQSGWGGTSYTAPRSAGPFAILDAIYESMQKVVNVDSDVSFPPLEVHWSPKNSPAEGNLWDGDIGGSFYLDGKIYVLGKADSDTDEYDRHIIIHEWGHILRILYRALSQWAARTVPMIASIFGLPLVKAGLMHFQLWSLTTRFTAIALGLGKMDMKVGQWIWSTIKPTTQGGLMRVLFNLLSTIFTMRIAMAKII